MHILMISDVFFPRINGVSTSIQTFRRQFEAMGHTVRLIAPDYPTAEEQRDDAIIRISSRGVWRDPEDRMLKYGSIMALTEMLRDERFDLIHVHTPFVAHYAGVELGKRLGIPVVESYHTFFEEYLFHYIPHLPRGWLRLLARHFSRTQCNAVDGVVVPSTAMAEVLRGYGVRNVTEIVPTGIDLESFEGGDGRRFREEHGIAADRPVMVHIGRIAHEKNISFLIDVLARVQRQVPSVLLVIAGEGPAKADLQAEVRRRKLERHVLFTGYLERQTSLLDCYRAGDLFVFSSNTETQGLVLLEAMALGVPVLSTAVMGTRDVLRPGHGCVVAEEDVADFASRAVMMLRDTELREIVAHKGRQYVAGWSASAMAERMLGFYRRVSSPSGETEKGPEAGMAEGRREAEYG